MEWPIFNKPLSIPERAGLILLFSLNINNYLCSNKLYTLLQEKTYLNFFDAERMYIDINIFQKPNIPEDDQ